MITAGTRADGIRIPDFVYGTAWKEDETQRHVEISLREGFRALDTANQRRHYHEAAVGRALAVAIQSGLVVRDELFLQTKFTFRSGQDHRLPYDPAASIADQVKQSFASSLEHLGVDTIDSYLLHGPSQRTGLSANDWEAWSAIETIHESGRARRIGISNVSLEQLQSLDARARIPPSFVQNRCYAERSWDRPVREYCRDKGIIYQGFSLLTANRSLLAHAELAQMAAAYDRTASQIVFRFALDVGILPLTGTTNPIHMRADLDVVNFRLQKNDVLRLEELVRV